LAYHGGVPLRNDPSLKPEEIATITKWVDEGCPKGDSKDAPKPVAFRSGQEWDDANPPDLVLKLPEAFHLATRGEDHYRTLVFPLGNQEEKYVRKTQFIPGNKKVVHHSLAFYDGTGMVLEAQKRLGKSKPFGKGDEDYGPGYESGTGLAFVPNPGAVQKNRNNAGALLNGWVPGAGTLENPSGARSLIPPDASILMQTRSPSPKSSIIWNGNSSEPDRRPNSLSPPTKDQPAQLPKPASMPRPQEAAITHN